LRRTWPRSTATESPGAASARRCQSLATCWERAAAGCVRARWRGRGLSREFPRPRVLAGFPSVGLSGGAGLPAGRVSIMARPVPPLVAVAVRDSSPDQPAGNARARPRQPSPRHRELPAATGSPLGPGTPLPARHPLEPSPVPSLDSVIGHLGCTFRDATNSSTANHHHVSSYYGVICASASGDVSSRLLQAIR
jgi:hypothetical protein